MSWEEFIEGQAYNVPKYGDSVDTINAKLKQLNNNLVASGKELSIKGYEKLVEIVSDLVKDSGMKISGFFIDFTGKTQEYSILTKSKSVVSFNMEVVRK